jgi:hypothetical protein
MQPCTTIAQRNRAGPSVHPSTCRYAELWNRLQDNEALDHYSDAVSARDRLQKIRSQIPIYTRRVSDTVKKSTNSGLAIAVQMAKWLETMLQQLPTYVFELPSQGEVDEALAAKKLAALAQRGLRDAAASEVEAWENQRKLWGLVGAEPEAAAVRAAAVHKGGPFHPLGHRPRPLRHSRRDPAIGRVRVGARVGLANCIPWERRGWVGVRKLVESGRVHPHLQPVFALGEAPKVDQGASNR